MDIEILRSPVSFLRHMLGALPHERALIEYESWWETEGKQISDATDRAGTPWLRMFDRGGRRVDEILFAPEYWRELRQGYKAGVVWRAFDDQSLSASALLDYITCFYDPGLTCPYVISLATAVALDQHGDEALKARFLPPLLRRDDSVWQGATWMTEIKGGSDLGANVETVARRAGDRWLLSGDKYFASNAGADLAVVAARPEGAPPGVRGLALFLLPKRRADGELNYTIRRLKDKVATRSVPTGEVELRASEAWMLGSQDRGVHLILEVLNLSRATNALGSMAIAQRALAESADFTRQRVAFGKPVFDHPLMRKQVDAPYRNAAGRLRAGMGKHPAAERSMAREAALFGPLSPFPAGGAPGEILDVGRGAADRAVGHGSAWRLGSAGGVSGGALVPRGHGADDLGRHVPSPDTGRLGGDGAQGRARLAVRGTE